MRDSITNYKPENSKEMRQAAKAKIRCCLFFAFAFLSLFSENSLAQNLSPEEIRQQAERLQSKDVETRRDALHKLRTSESEEASRIATSGLDDKAEIVRATTPFSILELPREEAAANLLPHLKDKSEFVRRETAYALGRTRSTSAVPPLLEILRRDKQYQVKCSAVVALGEIGELSAADALTRILQTKPKEDEEFLRRAAARSIGQIAEITLQKEFLAQTDIKDYNRFVIENRKLLTQKHPLLRNSLSVLIRVLQNLDEADDVKREAAFALGAIGDASAIPVLQLKLAAEDYYLVEISRRSLQKISAPLPNP
jgi:HEAT repeat protein